MKGFILAGGEGTRLYPITLETPKPLITVHNVPVLSYLVDLYLNNDVDDIRINIQQKHLQHFEDWKKKYFPNQNIKFIIEPEPSGTFAPLMKAEPQWFSETIVVSNGDELKELNLKEMIDWHKKQEGLVTIGLIKVENAKAYGSVELKENKIIKFGEKSEVSLSSYINSGLYIMNPGIKEYFPKNSKFSMLEEDLFPILAQEGKLFGYKWQGKWQDVGTLERWEQAIKTWKNK